MKVSAYVKANYNLRYDITRLLRENSRELAKVDKNGLLGVRNNSSGEIERSTINVTVRFLPDAISKLDESNLKLETAAFSVKCDAKCRR